MTLDQLIDSLLKLKNDELFGNGSVQVELVPEGEDADSDKFGFINSVEVADRAEDEYDPVEEDFVTKTIVTARINFTEEYRR